MNGEQDREKGRGACALALFAPFMCFRAQKPPKERENIASALGKAYNKAGKATVKEWKIENRGG